MPRSHRLNGSLPEVIVTSTVSVDGRITLGRSQRLMDPDVAARWSAITVSGAFADRQSELRADAVLEGSGSFVDDDAPAPKWPPASADSEKLYQDHLPGPSAASRWFVVADSRGRVPWSFTGDDQMRLLVLVSRTTPAGYLGRLLELGVPYIVTGRERVDLREALSRLARDLGVRRVVADSGGTLNASLFAADLVDVVDIVTLPGLVGGAGTPTMFDGPELDRQGEPIRLELIDVTEQDGAVRSRYRVLRQSS